MTGFESLPTSKEKARKRVKDQPAENLKENPDDKLEEEKQKEKEGTMAAISELASDVRDGVVDTYDEKMNDLRDAIEGRRQERIKDNPELAGKEPTWWRTALDGFMVGFGWLNNKVSDVFTWFFGEKKGEEKGEEGQKKEVKKEKEVKKDKESGLDRDLGDYEVLPKVLENAGDALKSAIKKHPEWLGYAKEASKEFGMPVATILAIIYFESSFNPTKPNVDGSCVGLGQFWYKTWPRFCENVPRFKDAKRTEAKASIFAVAWYGSANAKDLGMVLDDEAYYLAHHEGAGAAEVYLKGGEKRVPKHYRNKNFAEFKVAVGGHDDYENYRILLTRMSAKVAAVAKYYDKVVLPEFEVANA